MSDYIWNQGNTLGWLQERSFPHGQGNNAPLIMAVDINIAKEYAQRAYDAGRNTLTQASESPLCDVTQTPRRPCALNCGTYAGNLGPCETWEEGHNGRCVYCDHGKQCHAPSEAAAQPTEGQHETT